MNASRWGILLIIGCSASLWAQETRPTFTQQKPVYIGEPASPYVIDVDLRTLAVVELWQPGDPIKEVPRIVEGPQPAVPEFTAMIDPLLNLQYGGGVRNGDRTFDMPLLSLDGIGFSGSAPADPVGDVGILYYIQAVNTPGGSVYTIYNKSDGSVAAGPIDLSAAATGECADGNTDPIVLFDEIASRWLIAEISDQTARNLCVYISQTEDPIAGGWFLYEFDPPSFADYAKYGVWSGMYVVTSNEAQGGGIYALDRTRMLAGEDNVGFQYFFVEDQAGFSPFQAPTPADLDGDFHPAPNAPALLMRHRDDELHDPMPDPDNDFLQLWELRVDFDNPNGSALMGPTNIPITNFDSELCLPNANQPAFNCFPQPGTATLLDPIREFIMHRLQYREFVTHKSLVGSFVTDVDGTDRGGVRWFELRKTDGDWSLHQEGTWSPDASHRWMSSISMDARGNLALAYNVSNDTDVFPSLRYAGRLVTDAPSALPQGEYTVIDGTTAGESTRYGDYNSMNIDPVDDCTFWFTGQYNSPTNWSTRIASFSFDNCACTSATAPTGLSAVVAGNNRVNLSWSPARGQTPITTYYVYRALGDCPGAFYTLIAADLSQTSFVDTTVSGDATYSYVVRAFDSGDNCISQASDCASVSTTGDCTLPPSFSGVTAVSATDNDDFCELRITWDAAVSQCGNQPVYNIYRSTEANFTPNVSNLIAFGLSGTEFFDRRLDGNVQYFYRVRAEGQEGVGDGPNGFVEDQNMAVASGTATGSFQELFNDDMENGVGTFTTAVLSGAPATPWAQSTDNSNSPTTSWFAAGEADVKDEALVLDLGVVPDQAGFSFFHNYNTEPTRDGGVLEYSTDGGNTWFDITASNGAGIPEDTGRITGGDYPLPRIGRDIPNPLESRRAWNGDSGGFIQTTVNLSAFVGTATQIRWRFATDDTNAVGGWYIDDVVLNGIGPCSPCAVDTTPFANWPVASVLDLIPTLVNCAP